MSSKRLFRMDLQPVGRLSGDEQANCSPGRRKGQRKIVLIHRNLTIFYFNFRNGLLDE